MDEQIRDKEHSTEGVDENTANAGENPTEDELWVEKRNMARETNVPEEEALATPLFEENQAQEFHALWQDVQAAFVDDPRNSVVKADDLVTRVIKSIEENFAAERLSMENQWNQGKDVSTEDLRLMLKRYRSFFDRLLTLRA
jgi:hypothetical protein